VPLNDTGTVNSELENLWKRVVMIH